MAFSSYLSASFNLEVLLGLSLFFQGIDDFLVIFIYLAAMGLSCGMWNFKLQHVGSGSLKETESVTVQLCPALCYSMHCSLPGSSVRGILQARILEWVAVPFSRGYSQPRDQTRVSCIAGRFFTICTTRKALIPYSGINPGPSALGGWSLGHWTTREVRRH